MEAGGRTIMLARTRMYINLPKWSVLMFAKM
jgi:hypothetical protein